MPNLADFTVVQIELWLLMLLRLGTAVFLLPVLSSEEIPARIKAGLAMALAILLFPALPETSVAIPSSAPELVGLAIQEIYVGLVIGFSGTLALAGLRIAGEWIDQETGFAMLQLFDPASQEPSSAIGNLLVWMFTVLLLVSGGYLLVLQALAESFQAIPLTGAQWEGRGMLAVFLRMTADAFLFGLKASAPVLAAILMSSLGLAVTARIMPQMNVWLVGMPLKILLGLVTVVYGLPVLWIAFQKHFDAWVGGLGNLIRLMGGR